MNEQERALLSAMSSQALGRYAAAHDVYGWMVKYGIGESEYGRLLDAMGRGKGVFYHRLFGHHPIFDFPLHSPKDIPAFMEHVFVSDLFTKQGLPIVPGDFLQHPAVRHFCAGRTMEWNFVNGFDLLSGTLAIYAGYKNLKLHVDGYHSIDTFEELAKELGIGALELALACCKHNPLLLFGAALHLAGTVVGVLGDDGAVYFRKINNQYELVVASSDEDLERAVHADELQVRDSEVELDELLRIDEL